MADLPSSFSKADIANGFHISPRAIDRMVSRGEVGYYMAGRSKRFLVEHVAQIVAALEVKPKPPAAEALPHLGLSPQSAARRRRAS